MLKYIISLPLRRLAASDEFQSRQAIKALVQQAEAMGFHGVTAVDHIVVPRDFANVIGERWHHPAAFLGFIAGISEKLQLISDVVVLPYHNPLEVAKAFASVDALSEGRLILGVAPGYLEGEFKALGVPFAERGPRTDEYIEVIKTLWTEDNPTFEGKYYRFSNVVMEPKPWQKPRPPIWIGGNTHRAVRRAVERADGWVPYNVTPEELGEGLAHARTLNPRKRLTAAVHPGRIQFTQTPGGLGPTSKGRKLNLTGTTQQVREVFQRFVDNGAEYFVLGFGGQTLKEYFGQMETFMGHVASHLKEQPKAR